MADEDASWVDVREVLRPERHALIELLSSIDEAGWQAPTECPAWSVKGIALHLLGDDLSVLARQRDGATPGVFIYAESHPGIDFRGLLDGFNEQWVVAAQFVSPELLLEMLRLTGDWTADFYAGADPATLGEPVGFFGATGPAPYWQISAREYVERWVHHHQILRALGMAPLGPEFLVPATDVVVTGLAAHLPDLGARDGACITLELTGLRTWTLCRSAGRWKLQDDGNADAALTLDAVQAAAVFSRGLDADGIRAALILRGDPSVAGPAADAIARIAARPG